MKATLEYKSTQIFCFKFNQPRTLEKEMLLKFKKNE